jgi:hypothetical protein
MPPLDLQRPGGTFLSLRNVCGSTWNRLRLWIKTTMEVVTEDPEATKKPED